MKKIYVGNLPFSTTDEELANIFQSYGEVSSSRVVKVRYTGRSRGFGFVPGVTASMTRYAGIPMAA